MTPAAVSFEKVFPWTKYLSFEGQNFVSLECFMKKTLVNGLAGF